MKSPLALLLSLLTDVNRLERGVKGLDRDIITIQQRFKEEGVGFLTVALPSLGKALDRSLADEKFTCPLGFSKLKGGALPRLFSGLLCKIFDPKTGILNKEKIDVGTIKSLRDILYLFKKAIPNQDRVEVLDHEARTAFWSCDDEVLEELPPDIRYQLTSVSRYFLKSVREDPSEYLPKHGPGSVFEGCTPNQKWVEVLRGLSKDDPRLVQYEFDTLLSGSFSDGDVPVDFGTVQRLEPIPSTGQQRLPSSGVAKLVTVPKSSTARRTITVEPVVNQFLQQSLNKYLRNSIRKCFILSHCLALTDQGENQKLAVIGSQTGAWATIDLSSASDLLGCELVKTVFGDKQRLTEMLWDCRTPQVLRDGSPQNLRKYAGMGNATTFPVQSVVFACIAIAAILVYGGQNFTYRNVRRAACSVRVYGDDIIVRTEHYRHVADWLSRCGLRLNASKTYSTGNFRESCGVDAYLGVDVTPVYAKTLPVTTSKSPDHLADMVSLRNALRMRCYYRASHLIETYVEKSYFPLPYVTFDMCQRFEQGSRKAIPVPRSDLGCLGWIERSRCYSFGRINMDLQRHELRAPVIESKDRKDLISGHTALLKCLTTPFKSRERPDHLEVTPQRFKSKIRWRWVPSKGGKTLYQR